MPSGRLLARLLPSLEQRFVAQTNAQGLFPILPEKQSQAAWSQFPNRSDRQAAILIPVIQVKDDIHILFTKRSSKLRSHSSEISFPGGGREDHDMTLTETALRETQEELQTNLEWQVVGLGTSVPSLTGIAVTPVLAVHTTPLQEVNFVGHPNEVESVFSVSIDELLRVETSRPLDRLGGGPAPVFKITHFGDEDDTTIWGLTAFVLRPILHKVLKPVFLQKGQ